MNPNEQQYLDAVYLTLESGHEKGDRTGTGTLSRFGHQMRFDLQKGLPAFTTKKLYIKGVIGELIWFLKGGTNIDFLNKNNIKIWDQWRKPYSTDRELTSVEPRIKRKVKYSGDFKGGPGKSSPLSSKLYSTWSGMMKRCYDENHHQYSRYGEKGVTVCKRWHNLYKFTKDVQKLPHWFYKENNWNEFDLDKDYYGSNQYGPSTCVWLSSVENNFYTSSVKPVVATSPEGVEEVYLTLSRASKELGISRTSLHRYIQNGLPEKLKGSNKEFLGWEFKYKQFDGKLIRLELIPEGELGPVYGSQWRSWGVENNVEFPIDQIKQVIESIKSNPNSRRHIVSAWNVQDIDKMALPPCHVMFQFYVHDGKLSCQLYQRSADMFLGVPFNVLSYSILVHLIAQVCGLEPGEFVHTIGDMHLYKNHLEQVHLMLSRLPLEPASLWLDPSIKNIDDFDFEHIKVLNYNSHPSIKAPVAV